MAEKKGDREDYYEGQNIDMSTAVDHNSIMETGAKDSPAMTGESKEEVAYTNPPDSKPD
jgi:hypothetical protein